MSRQIGNSPFLYNDKGSKVIGVQSADGTVSTLTQSFSTLSEANTAMIGQSGLVVIGSDTYNYVNGFGYKQNSSTATVTAKSVGAIGDGIADDTTAINALFAQCAASGMTAFFEPGTYKSSGGHAWDYHKFSIAGSHAAIDFSTMSNSAGIFVYSSDSSMQVTLHTLSGLELRASRTAGQVGISYSDPTFTSINYSWGTLIRDCVIRNFDSGIVWGNNSWLTTHDHVLIWSCNTCLSYPSGKINSGENLIFNGCTFANSTVLVNIAHGSGQIRFTNCSFDYFTQSGIVITNGGAAILEACHLEASSDAGYWLSVSGSGGSIVVNSPVLYLAGNRAAYQLFYGQPGVNCGIFIDQWHVALATGITYGFGAYGTGNVFNRQKSNTGENLAATSIIGCTEQNILTDGTLANTTVNRWQFSDWKSLNSNSSTGLTISANTLKIQPQINTRFQFFKNLMCGAGSQIVFNFNCQSFIDNATDTLTITIAFRDSDGLQTYGSTPILINQANQQAAAITYYASSYPAPSGTAYCSISVQTNGNANTGNSYHILSKLNIEVVPGQSSALFYDSTGTATNTAVDLQPNGSTIGGASTGLTKTYTDTVIGQRVFFDLNISWTAFTGTGGLRLINLPRPSSFANNYPLTILTTNVVIGAGFTLVSYIQAGTTNIIIKLQNNTTGTLDDFSVMPNTASFYISGSYQYGVK